MQSLIRSKSAGVTGGRGTAGASPGRDLLYYEHAWQRKRWRVWRDGGYIADFSPGLLQEDQAAEEPSASTPGKGGPHSRAATLGNLMEVGTRSKARPARLLHLKRSGPSRDVESANRGVPPRPRPSASSSSSSVAPPCTAPQRGEVARADEHVCGVPCNLRVARDRAAELGFRTSFIKNNRFFSIIFSKITGYSDCYF